MKTIVLAVPPMSLEQRHGQFHRIFSRGTIRPPLGLLYLGAVLKNAGHRVHLVDAFALGLSHVQAVDRIMRLVPDMVGFTSYTVNIASAGELARQVKLRNRRVLTVIGGPHVTAVPDETMENFEFFDVGVIGEGEATILELSKGGSIHRYAGINGLIFQNAEKLHKTPPRPFLSDLDKLPFPAWELLQQFPNAYPLNRTRYRRYPVAEICTSRGCPYQCTFCLKLFGSRYRTFSNEYVIEAIGRLRQTHGIKELMFKDDMMMLKRDRVVELCEQLLKKNWGLTWTCMGRVDRVDLELLRLMRRSGCWQISYGIESSNQQLLDVIKKRTNMEKIETALHHTKKAGISPRGYFVLGLPNETEHTIRQTMDFAKRSPLDEVFVTMLTPFPGTELYKNARQYGTFEADWTSMNMITATFVPFGMSKERLEWYLKRFYLEFFVRPRIVFNFIKQFFVQSLNVLRQLVERK